MAGLLLLWLVVEVVAPCLQHKHVGLYRGNSWTVSWITRMTMKSSKVVGSLLLALALWLKEQQASPLTPLYIAGKQNRVSDIPSKLFGCMREWYWKIMLLNNSTPWSEILGAVPYSQQHLYNSHFCLADTGYRNGWVEAIVKTKEKYHRKWLMNCQALGVEPLLAKGMTTFTVNVSTICGFFERVKIEYYRQGCQVAAGAVLLALTAIGQAISMDTGVSPIKVEGPKKLLCPIQVVLDRWKKKGPP